MSSPAVSFVVPCYKLAHLLPECVNSMLGQTFEDFEVLVMDDCSPDDTAEVARSFGDPRVIHVRNDPNLGHLANYNKGIGLARGRYIWLISADDYISKPYALGRYVEFLDAHPTAGYAFCPATSGGESDRDDWVASSRSLHGAKDRLIPGHELLKVLLWGNPIAAPSGCVRRTCYEKLGAFPLNLPWAGDWYLWCLFAMHFDVAYLAEPMVFYRDHDLTMTAQLHAVDPERCCEEEVSIPWALKAKAEEAGFEDIAALCLDAVARAYARGLVPTGRERSSSPLSFEHFEASLAKHCQSAEERRRLRVRVLARAGDQHYWNGDRASARRCYREALAQDPWMMGVRAKSLLAACGSPGFFVRDTLRRALPLLRGLTG